MSTKTERGKRRPQVNARIVNGRIHINLDFRGCFPSQVPGKAVWVICDCDMKAPFKVQIGDMEIQPKIICKVIATANNDRGRLHLARQAAKAALSGEIQAP